MAEQPRHGASRPRTTMSFDPFGQQQPEPAPQSLPPASMQPGQPPTSDGPAAPTGSDVRDRVVIPAVLLIALNVLNLMAALLQTGTFFITLVKSPETLYQEQL